MRVALFALVTALSGCVVYQVPPPAPAPPPPEPPSQAEAPPPEEPASEPAVSVNIEPALVEPAPIAVGWAPPPMLVEVPPPSPFFGAVWVGGYWVWQGNWVWAHGHWMGAPRPDYVWVHPYYEHRGDAVIFIDGHWSAPGVVFVPPPPTLRLVVETPAAGVIRGPRPIGPEGCFVPAPPGSRAGIIIPAPVGTAPAVVTSAPAVVNVGMHITNNVTTTNNNVNNVTNVTNITRVTNVTNVTIVAPPAATASGRAFNTTVPTAPHLAAARPALVQARAPEPVNTRPLPVYTPGSRPPPLPHPQPVSAGSTGHPGEAFGRERGPESLHGGPGSAAVPQAAHPTPTALGRDPSHPNPESARSEREYPGGYEHQPAPQGQGDHKAPPQPQNQYHPAPQPAQVPPPAQPQNANRPAPQPPQPQNGSHPAPQAQGDHHNAVTPQSQHQGAPGAAAHAQGDNRSHKPEGQSEHDAKHDQKGNEH
jgi:hypothetical protein